jgi:hypothetical protein
MRSLLLCLVAAGTIAGVTPASARVWFDAGPVGVRIGPPPWRHHWVEERVYYEPGCRYVRERIRRPNGRVVVREREICS